MTGAEVHEHGSTRAAVEAFQRGYQAVPIRDGGKRPYGAAWTHTRWDSEEQVRSAFDAWNTEGASGIGLLLGQPSGGLIDVDLDHARALRLRDYFLPPTPMRTGRAGRPRSHCWYVVEDELPSTRRYKMPDGSVSVELRSTGSQTVIPPSTWYPAPKVGGPTETYRWEGSPWGGKRGPAKVEGRKLAIQVALLGLGSVLLDAWPKSGSRHETYLALAGGLLRYGDAVHPYWERNLPVLIAAMADVTHDEDGPEARIAEVMGSTITRLREGTKVTGFPRLAELIGIDHAELVRRMAREVESLGGFQPGAPPSLDLPPEMKAETEALESTLPPEVRNPMEERISSWAAVDMEPYLAGLVTMPEPSVLRRVDGKGLFYPGRVNSLFGLSESAKSWISLATCVQEMGRGDRVVYIDLEDEPVGTLDRLRRLGAGDDDIKNQFRYVHPEGPLADMQRYRFGNNASEDGKASASVFKALLEAFDPTLIVADGMTVLYGLHGHDTNEATATDVITSWLKSLCRGGRTTVIVIDHTGKGGGAGSSPIGAHHKIAMVQGTAIRADAVQRPMPGEVGRVRLIVYKDRPGAVRAISTRDREQVAGIVVMDSTQPGITRLHVEVPEEGEVVIGEGALEAKLAQLARSAELEEQVIALFGGDIDKYVTTAEAMAALHISQNEAYDVWHNLKQKKIVVQEGVNRWTKFRLYVPPPEKGETDG